MLIEPGNPVWFITPKNWWDSVCIRAEDSCIDRAYTIINLRIRNRAYHFIAEINGGLYVQAKPESQAK